MWGPCMKEVQAAGESTAQGELALDQQLLGDFTDVSLMDKNRKVFEKNMFYIVIMSICYCDEDNLH